MEPSAGAGASLELRDVAVSAGGSPLLAGVSARIAPGECVALRGPSGCGKTTLLRVIAALDDATAGEILLDGRPPFAHGWPRYRRAVGLVTQASAMLPGSVHDNLARPFGYHVSAKPFPEDRARELLDALAIGAGRLDQRADTLSAGQRQRVALVRALLVAPRVLLLDEPTSTLDEEAVELVEACLADERARGTALLAVTHDPQQAGRLADRVIDLREHVAEVAGAS